MQVRLLGHIEVVPDEGGTPLVLGGPTLRRVLALLAIRRNEVVSLARLIEVVWPDGDPPGRAEHNVRTYVHRLRNALDGCGHRLETAGAGYRLRLETDEFDAAEYDRVVGAAARLARMGETTQALDLVEVADLLWRGDPLAEFEGEMWARPHVVRLQNLRSEVRALKASLLIEAGQASTAIGLLERLVPDDPLQERPRALLMRALYQSGRQVEALRVYQEFRRLMIDETGIEPTADLAELDRAILMSELPTGTETAPKISGYRLAGRIGDGEFTAVYKATQAVLDRPVAIKVIKAELANRPEFIRRFETGASMVAQIEHPNVVPLYDYWREPDQAYLVMRWMDGGSLQARLDGRPWSPEATVDLIDQVAEALDAAHAGGVVHGDVRPKNILFDADGRAHLGDFSIAQLGDRQPSESASNGSGGGAASQQSPVPEADVFGLATVAFTLLAGRPPDGEDRPLPRVTEFRPDLPAAVDEVLGIASAASSADRYPTATSMAMALRVACLAAPPSGQPPRIRANPYKGLRPFTETDRADFHGRERLVDELITHASTARMLAVVGPSGSGKSSVVRAGLVPALRLGRIPGSERWFVTMMTPGARPFEALEAALLKIAVDPPATLLDLLRDGARGMTRAVKRVFPGGDTVVLVIDQFEELFSSGSDDADLFLRGLAEVVGDPDVDLRLVITLRADFYDRPLRYPEFAPLLKANTVATTPLAPDELERAIVQPAAAVGVGFAPGLVAEIIAEVNQEPGSLPLLQYVLTRAFDAADADTIREADYAGVGRLTGAVAQEADAMWEASDKTERGAIARLFGRLVTLGEGSEDTRRRVSMLELDDDPSTRAAIERFSRARLLTFDQDPITREPTVELAHEAIIRECPLLRGFLDRNRQILRARHHLTLAAATWVERGRDPSELYRGARLDAAEELVSSPIVTLNPSESEFLNAGLEHRELERTAEHDRLRRLHRFATAATVAALVALLAGVGAVVRGRQATLASRAVETGRIVATAQSLAESKPRAAVLLALAAYQRERSPRTLGALQTALAGAGPALQHLGWGTDYLDVEWLSDATVVGIRDDGLDLFDLTTGQIIDTVEMAIGIGVDAASSIRALDRAPARAASGGAILAVAGAGADILVYAVDGQFTERFRATLPADTVAVDVSPDGRAIVATAADGTVSAWSNQGEALFASFRIELAANLTEQFEAATGRAPQFPDWFDVDPVWVRPIAHDDHVHLAAGSMLSTIGYDGRPVAEPVTTYLELGPGVPQQVIEVVHDAAGTVLVGTSSIGFDTGEGTVGLTRIFGTFGSTGLPMAAVFPTGDGMLAAVLEDGSVIGLDPGSGEPTPHFRLKVDPVRAAVTSPQLDRLALATAEGLVIAALDGSGPLFTALPRDFYQRNISISEDGRYVVIGPNGWGADVSIYALEPGRGYQLLGLSPPATNFALRPPDSLWVAALDGLWLTDYDQSLYRLDGEAPEWVGSGRRSVWVMYDVGPTGQILAAGEAFDERVVLLDPTTFAEVGEVPLPPDIEIAYHLGGLRFDSDGERLLVSSRFGRAELWDTTTWTRVENPDLAGYDIASGYWSGDGSLVATASSDGQITIRNGQTFEPIRRVVGAARPVGPYRSGPMLFSADKAYLLTDHDNVIRLWDVGTGEQVGTDIPTWDGTASGINGGEVFHGVTAGEHHALIWNLDLETWPELACLVAGSNLTVSEWEQWGPADEPYRSTCPQFP